MDHDNEFYRQIDQAERERRAKEQIGRAHV